MKITPEQYMYARKRWYGSLSLNTLILTIIAPIISFLAIIACIGLMVMGVIETNTILLTIGLILATRWHHKDLERRFNLYLQQCIALTEFFKTLDKSNFN